MKSLVLNAVFLLGYSCCVSAAFLVAVPLGLIALGLPMVLFSLLQAKALSNDS